MNRSQRQRLFSLATIVTQERSETPSLQQVAGMSQPELLYSWQGEGMTWYFRESRYDAPMILSLDAFLNGNPLPPRLLNATTTIHFSAQRNAQDMYWEMIYDDQDFVSLADSGDGGICVYNDSALTWEDFIHEAAHNLALSLYGNVVPAAISDFVKATEKEDAPTHYAANGLAEDFAESVTEYFVRRNLFELKCPARALVIGRIMIDDEYAG